MSTYRQVEIVGDGDVAVVHLLDQTLDNRRQIASAAKGWLTVVAEEHCRNLLLDCSGVRRLSSDVLSELLLLDRQLRRNKAGMTLCGVSPAIRAMFNVTKLDRLFEIRDAETQESMALA